MRNVLPAPTTPLPFVDVAAGNREVEDELRRAWDRVVSSGRCIGGPDVEQFEERWAARCGRGHAVGVANGTDALELVLTALGIGWGHEVVLPTNTFVATAEAVVRVGATPRFADVDPDTLLLTPATVEAVMSHRTSALIAVDLFGALPDMSALAALADRAGIVLLEDAAQAHGARLRGRPAGSFGLASCFSFYPGKNLGALGDAGAVVTDDTALAERVRCLADHGRSARDAQEHLAAGVNSRLDAVQAAVLLAKEARLDAWNERRAVLAARYSAGLADTDLLPVETPPDVSSAHHLYVVRTPDRDAVQSRMTAHGVTTGIHYRVPCHRTPAFSRFAVETLPVAEAAALVIVSLPMYPHLRDSDVDYVCGVARGAVTAVAS